MNESLALLVLGACAATALDGCARLGFEPASRDAADGGVRDTLSADVFAWRDGGESDVIESREDAASDGGNDDGGTIDPRAPFAAPVALTGLNTPGLEDDPTLTADMLQIYFERAGEIYFALRPDISAAFRDPVPSTSLNTTEAEGTPQLTADGLTIYFSRGLAGNADVFVSTRHDLQSAWTPPVAVQALNSTARDAEATPTSDHLAIVLYSERRDPGGDGDIMISTRASTAAGWSPPRLVPGVNTLDQTTAWLSDDRLTIYFESTMLAGSAFAKNNLWLATRAQPGDGFGDPTPIDSVNSDEGDSDVWLSPDQRWIYFTRSGNGRDLYYARR